MPAGNGSRLVLPRPGRKTPARCRCTARLPRDPRLGQPDFLPLGAKPPNSRALRGLEGVPPPPGGSSFTVATLSLDEADKRRIIPTHHARVDGRARLQNDARVAASIMSAAVMGAGPLLRLARPASVSGFSADRRDGRATMAAASRAMRRSRQLFGLNDRGRALRNVWESHYRLRPLWPGTPNQPGSRA